MEKKCVGMKFIRMIIDTTFMSAEEMVNQFEKLINIEKII